jgi:lipoprotein-anchoring transpeptidase ErfK/SrfK
MRTRFWTLIVFALWVEPAVAASISADAVNSAQWTEPSRSQKSISPVLVKLQILLDRAHFSPGEIDGRPGENSNKAIAAYAAAQGAGTVTGMTAELWQSLAGSFKDPVIVEHKISESEIKGPFAQKIPAKMEDMQHLPALAYTSLKEMLAERFHMSLDVLAALNPSQTFDKAGDTIMVANVTGNDLPEKAARIKIDKTRQTLSLLGKSDTLLAVYPVTAGSTEKPAPDGTLKVKSITKNPTYRYNPDYAFKGVKTKQPFTIEPGPNNPVGLVWIGLNREGYGIHGTPDPAKVSKTASHGCIRLTNWDALQVASAIAKGAPVEFSGDETERDKARAQATGHKPSRARRHRH